MKRLILALAILATTSLGTPLTTIAAMCNTIPGGNVVDSAGNPIGTGFDVWGYNYQAHRFSSYYDNNGRPAQPYTEDDCEAAPNGCVNLEMKWDDVWLSNQDCNDNGLLDRPTDDGGSYIGTGAWITNHMSGSYEYMDERGKWRDAHWTYFIKIVAAPSDGSSDGAFWYEADGSVLGPVIWSDFAIVQELYNDPVAGFHGLLYLTPTNPGFGNK